MVHLHEQLFLCFYCVLVFSITEMSGEILNPESVMEYHPQSGILSVNFRNMVRVCVCGGGVIFAV